MAISVSGNDVLVAVEVGTGGTFSLGSGVEVSGKTAKIKVKTQTSSSYPTYVLAGGNTTETGRAVNISVRAGTGKVVLGNDKPGDHWISPTSISGTGSKTWAVDPYTLDDDEPQPTEVGGLGPPTTFYQSRWFRYTGSNQNVTFDVSSTDYDIDNIYTEIWDATGHEDDIAAWNYLETGTNAFVSATDYVTSNGVLLLRLSTSASDASFDATLAYVTTTPDDEGQGNLEVDLRDDVLLETPTAIEFNLVNADEEALITIELSGYGQVGQYLADDNGIILGQSVYIPPLDAGTYTLSFSGGGEATTNTFQVLEDSVPLPTAPGADDAPTPVSTPHRWILQDPISVLDQFEFTYNPTTMSDPFGARPFSSDPTTAPGGQSIVWEALSKAVEWTFSGYVDTEADYLALEDWTALRRRFFVIDHKDRYWVAVFTAFDPQPKRVIGAPFAHDYTIKALLYGEVT